MNNKKFSDFVNNDRFISYLSKTKMYKEAYSSKEGIFSIIISSLFVVYLIYSIDSFPNKEISDKLFEILGIIIGGGFGLLGFSIGGLGILVGSISSELISLVDKNSAFDSLFRIIFRFYYNGVILLILIFSCSLDIILIMTPNSFNLICVTILGFITSYSFCYSLILSVMLLGSSIRIMMFKHFIDTNSKSKDK